MAASLDDLLDELKLQTDILQELRENSVSTSQSGGSSASSGPSGRASSGGPGSLFGKGGAVGKALAYAKVAEGVSDFTGLSEGLKQFNLGASGGEALSSGARSFTRNVSNLPFGGIFAANTQQVLAGQDRAQQSVSGIVEGIARAGGSVSDSSITGALQRQNEIEANVQKAKVRVGQLQATAGGGELGAGVKQDAANLAANVVTGGPAGEALSALIPEIRALTDAIRSSLGAR